MGREVLLLLSERPNFTAQATQSWPDQLPKPPYIAWLEETYGPIFRPADQLERLDLYAEYDAARQEIKQVFRHFVDQQELDFFWIASKNCLFITYPHDGGGRLADTHQLYNAAARSKGDIVRVANSQMVGEVFIYLIFLNLQEIDQERETGNSQLSIKHSIFHELIHILVTNVISGRVSEKIIEKISGKLARGQQPDIADIAKLLRKPVNPGEKQ